ncbi:hypothetical protein D3C78_814150 [compost metagenome]
MKRCAAFSSTALEAIEFFTASTINQGMSKRCLLFAAADVNIFHPTKPILDIESRPVSMKISSRGRSLSIGWLGSEKRGQCFKVAGIRE